MKTLAILMIVSSLMSAVPASANDWSRHQAAATVASLMTTNGNAGISQPDQMVAISWTAPFIRFDSKERLTVKAEVLPSNSYGNFPLDSIAKQTEAAERTLWTEHSLAKNMLVFEGTPKVGDLVLRLQISYMMGQTENHSSNSGGSSCNDPYGNYNTSHSDYNSSTMQESYINLHVDLLRKGEGDEMDVVESAPDIQAYQNGMIRVENSSSGNNGSGSTGCGRNIFGGRQSSFQCQDFYSNECGWSNDGRLLEVKAVTHLSQYLATGAHALVCQAIKTDQALATPKPLTEK